MTGVALPTLPALVFGLILVIGAIGQRTAAVG